MARSRGAASSKSAAKITVTKRESRSRPTKDDVPQHTRKTRSVTRIKTK